MAMSNTTKMANRYGLDIVLTSLSDSTKTATIDFANEVSIEVTGEITWATGGQGHTKMIGFKDPKEGSIKISTQIVNMQILALLSDGNPFETNAKVSFKDDILVAPKYYKIEGKTVWQDESGNVYNETITAYKALVKPNYNAVYNGSGDPISIDLEFELASDSDGNFLDIERAEQTSNPSTGDQV